ncbi:MAG: hypothetical protein Q8O35_13620 [Humidesulfovibrio sp.]|uniref:carboxymuconolactone decarboxylase family protein n=1 Tax=Humidesulfovibrio sp. TaxID=2910988 RepID=UPI0027348167|nr:hypothetical protein [Humidesulfovibrio sp.]MDP2849208.1 hypothetical protein [Humidesulfovibrio sp.]
MSEQTNTSPFRLATQTPKTATDIVAEVFKLFPKQVGIPEPLLLFSASPGLLGAQMGLLGYYRSHPGLSFELLAAIRYLASRHLEAPACLEFNHKLLLMAGMTNSEIQALPGTGGAFSEAERAVLYYAVRVLAEPESITDETIEDLRGLGWTDSNLLDAAMQAVHMQVPAALLKALKR